MPLFIRDRRDYAGYTTLAMAAVLSAAIYLIERSWFRDNPGDVTELHVFDNLEFYPNPANLFDVSIVYGIPMPVSFSLVTIILLNSGVHVWLARLAAAVSRVPRPILCG